MVMKLSVLLLEGLKVDESGGSDVRGGGGDEGRVCGGCRLKMEEEKVVV